MLFIGAVSDRPKAFGIVCKSKQRIVNVDMKYIINVDEKQQGSKDTALGEVNLRVDYLYNKLGSV